jgi:hypothetical protein
MTRQCIVHIGMHKTGSTSIQHSLFRNTSLTGAVYIDLDVANASGRLATLFSEEPGQTLHARLHGLSNDEVSSRQRRLSVLLSQQFDVDADRFILSGEAISRFAPSEVERLFNFLRTRVDSVEVVGYVRGAAGFMQSALQQRVKGSPAKHLTLANLYPRYRSMFEKFDQIVGRERVQLWPFEPRQFPEQCVVRDFCQRLQLSLDEATIVRVNESLSRQATVLMYLYRMFAPVLPPGPGTVTAEKNLVMRLADLAGGGVRLSPKTLRPIFDRHRNDLDWMAARLGVSVSALGEALPDDVGTEADLLQVAPQTLAWLSEQLGEPSLADASPEQIGAAMGRLRDKPAGRAAVAS